MALAPGTRLGPYEVLAPFGAGGMGEVYRARDTKLDREVAIKVLPESVAADPSALARFEREAKAVAALSHTNILSIFDFGTHEGVSYAVMELLEGETLRAKLEAGATSQKQAVDYALQIAKGLSAAHEKGVVHRDLKPENLFVQKDGHLKILDFGLAKRETPVAPGEETSAPTVSRHTEPGTVMGTVGYMSPEQVRGLPVDNRSDIFSFGAILYELLSGKRAFQRATSADTMSAILNEEPPELSQSGRTVSLALDRVVRHCLEKDRNNRFQTAKDVAFNLSEQSSPTFTSGAQPAAPQTGRKKALIAAAALVVLAGAGILVLRQPHKDGGAPAGVKRVAVLPFENLGAHDDDYFADGMADEIRGKLTSLPGVQVIARASSTHYKKTSKTPNEIAQELGAGYLLTATVRWEKSGGASRVHISPELVEVSGSGPPVVMWQQPFDAALTDVFQVQSDVASRAARALGVALGIATQRRLSDKPTENLAAYDLFLKGEEAWRNSGLDTPSVKSLLGFYEQAVALDPTFALAWARISEANAHLYYFTTSPEVEESARHAAEKALALAPKQPESYLALGNLLYRKADFRSAMEQYEKARILAPEDADVLQRIGEAELALGRGEAALNIFRKVVELNPWSNFRLGSALQSLGRYSESRAPLERVLSLSPTNLIFIQFTAASFLGEGDLEGARSVLRAVPNSVEPTALVAYMAEYGDLVWVLDDAQRELLLRLTPNAFSTRADWAIALAQACALKGDAACLHSYATIAASAFRERLREAPDAGFHSMIGLALAYLGQKNDAIREGELAVNLWPMTKDPLGGPYLQFLLVRIDLEVGEQEKALHDLETLVKSCKAYSSGWLRINPTLDPLRKNPRFQKLVAGGK